MKVMVFVKATKDSEEGVPPGPEAMEAMAKYTEALIAAGIIRNKSSGDSNQPASPGACVSQARTPR